MSESAPLEHIRMLDVSGDLGAYGAKLLADLGADVIKVEPAGGDPLRRRPPFAGGRDGDPDAGLLFAYYNANKRGVELDLYGPDDPTVLDQLTRLGAGRDLVLIAPSHQSVPGWDPATRRLSWADPDSIVCVLSDFGLGGPHDGVRATHLTSFAMSGQMQAIGPPDGPPRALPGNAAYDELSAHAAAAMMVALRERAAAGPQLIELSLHDMLAYRDTAGLGIYVKSGVGLFGRAVRASAPPSGIWDVADGRIELLVFNPPHWDGFCAMLDHPGALADPELRVRAVRTARAAELTPVVAELLAEYAVEDLVTRSQEYRVPCAPQYTPWQLTRDTQLRSRGFWATQQLPGGTAITVPGAPFISAAPLLHQHRRPAPKLGEHNHEALTETRVARLPQPAGPRIAQLKVLSFGTAIAGNVTATTLAEMGADVVKIEAPGRSDPLRVGPLSPHLPRVYEPSGTETNVMFAGYSRSCRSIALTMTDAGDRETFLDLARQADVLIDNFATGVMERWGLAHEMLAEVNPQLVMVTVSGYGRTGPRAHYMAYGSTINSFMGVTRTWAPHGTQFDYTAVAHVLPAIFAGLARRDRTGTGCIIDIAQSEAGAAVLAPLYLRALNLDDQTVPAPNTAPGSWYAGVLRCAGDDQWLAVELEGAADWAAVVGVLGDPQLARAERPGAAPPGADEVAALNDALARWAARLTPLQAERLLRTAGLAAAAVRDVADEYDDPQLWGRTVITTVEHPDLGELHYPAPFQRLSKTRFAIRRPTARLGQHTDEVLRDWLGEPGAGHGRPAVRAADGAGHTAAG
jgi:crotonobetainyl-CoA:carnitine CoA-transferase CaiB-like acyl-CoA transferase